MKHFTLLLKPFLFTFLSFLRLQYNYIISPFPFHSPNLPIYHSFLSFISSHFFINCYYIYACIRISIFIPKCNLIRMYNVTYMYVFNADYLIFSNKFVCPWRRLLSCWAFFVACSLLCCVEASHIHSGMSIEAVLFSSCLCRHGNGTSGIVSDIPKR